MVKICRVIQITLNHCRQIKQNVSVCTVYVRGYHVNMVTTDTQLSSVQTGCLWHWYDMIWWTILTCAQKLTRSQLRLFMTTTTTVLWPFVRDYPGEPVPGETLTHPPSWSSSNLYQLLPSTTINSILPVQTACLSIFLHSLSPCPLWSTSWSGALHLIFHTFLHPISVFFSQHMPIPSQSALL